MADYILTKDGELKHYGVLGMKWGVRRYQNKDGTLTNAGKKRYVDKSKVDSAKEEYKESKRAYNKAVNKASDYSTSYIIPTSQNRKKAKDLWDDVDKKESQMKSAKKALKTAEEEYKGEKLKQSADDYRAEMLRKYTGKDPQKTAFYTNASDELIQQEFVRRQNVKKAVIAGAAVVGIGAACLIAYKVSANKQLQSLGPTDDLKEAAKKALKGAGEDLDYVIPKGSDIHRMTGSAGFDLSKTVGKRTYVTVNDADRGSYAMFLRDWSGTGDRYDVTLKATKNIVAPSDERAKKIFKEIYDNDPTYRDELKKSLTKAFSSVLGPLADDEDVRQRTEKMLKDPFGAGMYAFVRQGKDADILTEAYTKAGYNAIVDYFDRGSLGKQPMILFDAAGSTTKTGERLIKKGDRWVSMALQGEYLQYLRSDKSHPMSGYV